jgi:hypothetical protein
VLKSKTATNFVATRAEYLSVKNFFNFFLSTLKFLIDEDQSIYVLGNSAIILKILSHRSVG